jgi:hypothetical protein
VETASHDRRVVSLARGGFVEEKEVTARIVLVISFPLDEKFPS